MPPDYRTARLGDHAAVAWDGKRSAARALADAMLILENKARVTVVTVGARPPAPAPEGRDLMAHLARHGTPAEALHVAPEGRTVGRALLDACAGIGAGLLVMGAYEHSKFGEDLIGGVTNEVMRRAPIPVLMAH